MRNYIKNDRNRTNPKLFLIINNFVLFVHPIFSLFFSLKLVENQEKFFLYLFISVTVGVLLCLTLVIGRLVLQKRQVKESDKKSSPKNQSQNRSNGDTTIPNGFSDDISEIDGDIDMTTTTLPVPSVSRSEVSQNVFPLVT